MSDKQRATEGRGQTAIGPEERELILQLQEDTEAIEAAGFERFPSSAQLRALITPVLRRWIVDGNFFLVQKRMEEAVQFTVYSNTDGVTACEAGLNRWWMGYTDCGRSGLLISPMVGTEKGARQKFEMRKPFLIKMKAKHFFEQKVFFWKGLFYSRSDLIKFAANKLGGVHYDLGRNKSDAHIEEIQNHFAIQYRATNIYMVPPGEIPLLRADPTARAQLYDAIQMSVGDTAKRFAEGVRSAMPRIEALLTSESRSAAQ